MKKNTFFLLSLVFLCPLSFSQNGWVQIQSPTNAWLEDVQAVNQNCIYAVGLGYNIIKSTDNGSTWSIQYSGANFYNFYSVCFLNPNTGYVGGGFQQSYPPYSQSGSIFKTTNGGVNWGEIFSAASSQFRQVVVIDSSRAFACENFRTYMTTNGGAAWSSIPTLTFVTSLSFVNQNTGFATSRSSIYKTTDGGFNWSGTNLSQGTLIKVVFANANTGYVSISNSSSLLKTTNGGNNWSSPIVIPDLALVNSIYCYNADTVFIAGAFQPSYYYGRIIRTTNGGQTWSTQYAGLASYSMLYSVSFYNSLTGFAVGPVGLILKTTTGGEGFNAVQNQNTQLPSKIELYQNYPNPFNPSTVIKIDIPDNLGMRSEISVSLNVYDIGGRMVAALVNGKLKAGSYSYDFDASNLSSGVYFYQLSAGIYKITRSMILLR